MVDPAGAAGVAGAWVELVRPRCTPVEPMADDNRRASQKPADNNTVVVVVEENNTADPYWDPQAPGAEADGGDRLVVEGPSDGDSRVLVEP